MKCLFITKNTSKLTKSTMYVHHCMKIEPINITTRIHITVVPSMVFLKDPIKVPCCFSYSSTIILNFQMSSVLRRSRTVTCKFKKNISPDENSNLPLTILKDVFHWKNVNQLEVNTS